MITTPYISIQSDFGFKYVFGSEKNKAALIRFLNILFSGQLTVTDVTFHDKEILPSEEEGKRIVYDVYCTFPANRDESGFFPVRQRGEGKRDHHFVLEMQNIYTPPFEERIVYYASKMVASQGKAGWNYELEPVFAIAVTDFNFGHMSAKLKRDVMFVDRETREVLTDKVHILLCSLKEVPSNWEECRDELTQILYLIKNMDKMDNTSMAYREGNFKEIFRAARSSELGKDQVVAYSQSLAKLRDTQAGIVFAADKAREEGRKEGWAEGRAEGRAEGERSMIKEMLSEGLSIEMVARIAKTTVEKIKGMFPQ